MRGRSPRGRDAPTPSGRCLVRLRIRLRLRLRLRLRVGVGVKDSLVQGDALAVVVALGALVALDGLRLLAELLVAARHRAPSE